MQDIKGEKEIIELVNNAKKEFITDGYSMSIHLFLLQMSPASNSAGSILYNCSRTHIHGRKIDFTQ